MIDPATGLVYHRAYHLMRALDHDPERREKLNVVDLFLDGIALIICLLFLALRSKLLVTLQ